MMCGRFSLWLTLSDLKEAWPDFEFPEALAARYNIAPSQDVAVVANNDGGKVEFFRWGLIPFWAKDPAIGNRMINARAETLAEKPSFRVAYRRRRCLILADGFYEWQKVPGQKGKTPMYVRMASGKPFAFAGLWERWQAETASSPIFSCTIITTEPNALIAPIHRRMPVIMPVEHYDRWLEPSEQNPGALQALLQPYPAQAMTAHPVSRFVNNPANDTSACIEPVS